MPEGHDLESYLSSLGPAADCLEASCLDGKQLGISNGTNTASKCCKQESKTDTLTTPRSSEISDSSSQEDMRKPTLDMSMSSAQASRSCANPSVSQESDKESTTSETCGPPPSNASAWYDPDTACWRTYQASLLADILESYSETWPKAGMTVDGVFYPQPKWEHRINEIGSGLLPSPVVPNGGRRHNLARLTLRNRTLYREDGTKAQMDLQTYVRLWPTPTINGNHNRKGLSPTSGDGLATAVNKWPTPQARDYRTGMPARYTNPERSNDLNDAVGGKLNPIFVEWLQGWPKNWTEVK